MAKKPTEERNPKELSRREFLKDAGLVVSGAAIGSIALAGACNTTTTTTENVTTTVTLPPITKQGETTTLPPSTVTNTATTTATATTTTTVTPPATTVTVASILPKSGYIQWNPDACMSCSRCLMVCAIYHEKAVSPPLSGIVWEDENEFSGFRFRQPLFCQQCNAPDCYNACPLKDKALCIDSKTGARYINKALCNGCGLCVQVCPLTPSRINLDPVQKKAIKCDMCKDRAAGPVCVEACDRLALSIVTKEARL
jgi:Fe-S-cluster-containing hydrogenase component 2